MFKLLLALLVCHSAIAFSDTIESAWDELVKKNKLVSSKQAFCIGDDFKTVSEKNELSIIKPASVSKLYTTYYSLKKLGLNYRHKTKLLFNDKENHLHIKGSKDPYFVDENIAFILNQLDEEGLTDLKLITFDENFLYNWERNPNLIIKILKQRLNNGVIKSIYETTYAKTFPKLSNLKIQLRKNDSTYSHYFEYETATLIQQYKYINMYSNNFYVDTVFESLGGAENFSTFINEEFDVDKKTIYFQTGSGLPYNYTTCNLTLRLLRKLDVFLQSQYHKLSDIMSVAGVDQGTLINRFTSSISSNSVIAKTGTLSDTSSLAGKIHTQSGDYYFGIFNNTLDRVSARLMQNTFIENVIQISGEKAEIPYRKIIFRADQDNIWMKIAI